MILNLPQFVHCGCGDPKVVVVNPKCRGEPILAEVGLGRLQWVHHVYGEARVTLVSGFSKPRAVMVIPRWPRWAKGESGESQGGHREPKVVIESPGGLWWAHSSHDDPIFAMFILVRPQWSQDGYGVPRMAMANGYSEARVAYWWTHSGHGRVLTVSGHAR